MKTKFKIMLLSTALCTGGLTACNDWFDVMPRTSIYEEDMYNHEFGFQKVVTGLYMSMTDLSLYGKQTTYGLVDVVGNIWYLPQTTNEGYKYAYQYNYENEATKSTIARIWEKAYNVIANANEILRASGIKQDAAPEATANREISPAFASEQTRNILTGEALAVRAYLHFDLLRMFGQNPQVAPQAASIPYVTTLSKEASPQLTTQEVVGKVKTDLLQAEKLLRDSDPIVSGTPEIEDNWYAEGTRFSHLNYYAVCGLLARVCLYAGDTEEAGDWALKVIESKKFSWVKMADVNKKDYIGLPELVFSLYTNDMQDAITPAFIAAPSDYDGYDVLGLQYNIFETWFDEANDIRREGYLYGSGSKRIPQKYVLMSDEDPEAVYRNYLPLVRLAEMYYIASERYLEKGDVVNANKMLNEVRKGRGLDEMDFPLNDIRNELTDEYRREFIGEGQLFYYVKRLNLPALIQTQFVVDFVFPLPDNETMYANRKPNK